MKRNSWYASGRLGKTISERFAHRYYDAVSVGIDFTARELQQKLRAQGLPWDLCKGFDGSAALGEWVSKDKFLDVQRLRFHLDINGQMVQEGCTTDMLYKVDETSVTLVATLPSRLATSSIQAVHQVVDLYISMTIWKDT